MTTLWIDLETYSEVPITQGTHRYAASAEIMLLAWALDEGPANVLDLANRQTAPRELQRALVDPDVTIIAHNSQFDRTVLRQAMPEVCDPRRWRDTMVQAMAHGLPGGLGDLCDILKVEQDKAKDKDGRALILLFCKPRPKTSKLRRATRDTHPAEWAEFVNYAALDIEAMRAVYKKLPTWNFRGAELALWHLDQKINDRGVAVDLDLANAAILAVAQAQAALGARTSELTLGYVESTTQRDALLKYMLAAYGVELPDLQMATLERRVDDSNLPAELRELIAIRLQASTTSTSKYKTLVNGASADGRLRGLLQFCGASRTGRWAGRLWQPQNLMRPTLPQAIIDEGIEALKMGCADLITTNVMELTGSAMRGCIVAPKGKKLVVADLSNIEGRDASWLAGEQWKLDAFRDFDQGTGPDLYKLSYAKSFGIDAKDVTKDQRQIGKTQELALQFEGGVGAFVTFAGAYKLDLEAMADEAQSAIPPSIWGQANIMLDWHRGRKRNPPADFGMADKTWLVCESFKLSWRSAHPNITAMWRELRDSVRQAARVPGVTVPCHSLKIRRDGAWLRIVLPSGRALCYPSPAVSEGGEPCPHCNGTGTVLVDKLALDCKDCEGTGVVPGQGGQISYFGVNQYSRKWGKLYTYGGKLFENCIAEDTPVLTNSGWLPIQHVTAAHLVWDGVDFVRHRGCAFKGKQLTRATYGVEMTPDHKVLTTKGWKNASSCAGFDRADCGLPGGTNPATAPQVADAPRTRPVYDLIDCGPRHRFVVRGSDGRALIVHNCCQAVARDVMAHNMPAIDARGYSIVLSVHDELICEAPDSDEFTHTELASMLAANPPWALDMPLAAAGFESPRYKKD